VDHEFASLVAIGALLLAERQHAELSRVTMGRKIGVSDRLLAALEMGDANAFHNNRELFLRTAIVYARKLNITLAVGKSEIKTAKAEPALRNPPPQPVLQSLSQCADGPPAIPPEWQFLLPQHGLSG